MKKRPFLSSGKVCHIPTYDGSNECTHPYVLDSVAVSGNPWQNYRYWMAFTPYPGNNPQRFRLENPSIVASNDAETWVIPEGVVNPLIPAPGLADLRKSLVADIPPRLVFWYLRGTLKHWSFNADPALLLDTDGTMYLAYVHTIKGRGHDEIVIASSSDGWRSLQNHFVAVRRFREPETWEINVPSIVRADDSTFHLYYGFIPFDGDGRQPRYDRVGLRRRAGPSLTQLGNPMTIETVFPPDRRLWHHELRRHPDGRLLCLATFALDEGPPQQMAWPPVLDLYYGEFDEQGRLVFDQEPILQPSAEGWDSQCIYKPSFLIEQQTHSETFSLWYSAQDAKTRYWKIGKTSSQVRS